jgi:hypothetical protein
MKRVRALQPFVLSGQYEGCSVGDITTVPDDIADRLVASGVAQHVQGPEAAVRAAPETAEALRPGRSKK